MNQRFRTFSSTGPLFSAGAACLARFAPMMVVLVGAASISLAATGDRLGGVTFSANCSSGLGTGISFDGTYLWVSCHLSNPDLLKTNPATGAVLASFNVTGGLGSIAYDANRNVIWAASGGKASGITKITLDGAHNVTGSSILTSSVPGNGDLIDGLGYDGLTDIIYYSPDGSTTIYTYSASTGAPLASFPWHGTGCYNSGVAIGGNLLFEGSDGCNMVWVVNKTTFAPAFNFSTFYAGDPDARDGGLTCDTKTFAPKSVMWSKEAYSPNRASAFEIPAGSCGVGGLASGGNDSFQVRYASNLGIGDSVVNITNTGSSSTVGLPTQNGNICANVYTFSPDEQLISCCTCKVTPNALASLSARSDLISNTLTPGVPTSIVIKLLASNATVCNASTVGAADNSLVPGMAAMGTTIHALPVTPGTPATTYGMTETPFTLGTLSPAELSRITTLCGFIQSNGSGFGICRSCRLGGLGNMQE